ncbi:hypothetical protein LMG27174_00730 [Paraburkholderia rhynchosiae]|uniref:Uncharacterized protein n=1 Tax=Paraburkholderia rhynchosiae TaxID=487049 RepID=A0A6J4ZVQ5_9BURK|nr:hypothetical protein LMG27174_00730 [Paraburkholderia rhynchosiae]
MLVACAGAAMRAEDEAGFETGAESRPEANALAPRGADAALTSCRLAASPIVFELPMASRNRSCTTVPSRLATATSADFMSVPGCRAPAPNVIHASSAALPTAQAPPASPYHGTTDARRGALDGGTFIGAKAPGKAEAPGNGKALGKAEAPGIAEACAKAEAWAKAGSPAKTEVSDKPRSLEAAPLANPNASVARSPPVPLVAAPIAERVPTVAAVTPTCRESGATHRQNERIGWSLRLNVFSAAP